jgi:hypothetical protein
MLRESIKILFLHSGKVKHRLESVLVDGVSRSDIEANPTESITEGVRRVVGSHSSSKTSQAKERERGICEKNSGQNM